MYKLPTPLIGRLLETEDGLCYAWLLDNKENANISQNKWIFWHISELFMSRVSWRISHMLLVFGWSSSLCCKCFIKVDILKKMYVSDLSFGNIIFFICIFYILKFISMCSYFYIAKNSHECIVRGKWKKNDKYL